MTAERLLPSPTGVGAISAAQLLDHLAEAALLADAASGSILYLNPAAERLCGWAAAEAFGQPLDALVPGLREPPSNGEPPAAAPPRWLTLRRRSGECVAVELVLRHPEAAGPTLLVLLRAVTTPVAGDAAAVAAEHDRLSAELRAAERRYRALTGSLLEAVYEADLADAHYPDGIYTYWSDRVAAVLGHPAEAFFRDDHLWERNIHPEDHAWVMARTRELFESGDMVDIEYRFVKPGGEVVWIEDRGQVERGPNGERLRLRGTKTDVSARKRLEAQLQRSEREARLLYQAALAIGGELELDAQLQRVLEATLQLTGADEAQAALVDASGTSIEVVAAWGEAGRTVGLRQPCGAGLLGQVCGENRPIRSADMWHDPRTYEPERMRQVGVRAWLGAPLADGEEVLGALIALRKQPHPFSDEDEGRLQALAALAAAVVRQGRLREEVRRLAAVEERTRLARELHDSVTQSLFSASMLAQAAQSLWRKDADRAKERLDRAAELCGGALAEMRALIFELRPDALAEEGLASALRKHAAAREARDGLRVAVHTRHERRLPPACEEAAYRIVREALHNVAKHARATRVDVELTFESTRLRLDMRDDGSGFDPAARAGSGLGLRSMRERAEQLGGALRVTSAPGAGTTIHAEIPLPHAE